MTATMNKAKYLFAFVVAALLTLALSGTALAGTITINPPDGVNSNATNTYKIYKVFEGTAGANNSISYKVISGKESVALPAGFVTDSAGNVIHGTKDATTGEVTPSTATELTADEIAAIAAYANAIGAVPVEATAAGTTAATATVDPGYYYITTSTGTVVTIDSTTPDATVNDKNSVPTLTKKITGEVKIDEAGTQAIQQVGKDVDYEAVVTIAKGFKNYAYHDAMTNQVLKGEPVVEGMTKDTDYTLTVGTDGKSFDIKFLDTGKIKTMAEGDTIKITYKGTITNEALTVDKAHNTAYVSYGDEGSGNKTPDQETDVYNATVDVDKQDGSNNNAPLAGAGFKLKNSEGLYYKFTAAAGTEPAKVEWVAEGNGETEYFTGANGKLETAFKGLAKGTYTLVESTVPAGYNKAADTTVTIANDNTAQNLSQTKVVVNNKGTELPSTGGMGTTIIYIIGGIMVLLAAVYLITKRRVAKDSDQ